MHKNKKQLNLLLCTSAYGSDKGLRGCSSVFCFLRFSLELLSTFILEYLFNYDVICSFPNYSDRRGGSSNLSYNRRYEGDDNPEDIMRASAALENLQLDRKTRNLTSSWRLVYTTIHLICSKIKPLFIDYPNQL